MFETAGLYVITSIIGVVLGVLFTNYIKETKHEKIYRLTIQLLIKVIETYNIPVPEFLQSIIDSLHSVEENTKVYEDFLLDEKIKNSHYERPENQ